MANVPHPFDPLSPKEITKAAAIVRSLFPGVAPNFRVITLQEPPKDDMIAFLGGPDLNQAPGPRPARVARVQVVTRRGDNPTHLTELLIDLQSGQPIKRLELPGRHPYIDSQYMREVEQACLADSRVQKELALLNIPSDASIVAEPWAYATDGMNDMTRRLTMVWFYMRGFDNPDSNHYAYPLDVCAEVTEELHVRSVYRLPSGVDGEIHNDQRPFDNARAVPAEQSEYHPSLRPPPRTTTKPLQVVQPEGPSFKTKGSFLSWEKWTLHVGFNYREGLTLHDVRYDGRSLFYRLALSEMFVPYGDPRTPYPRKAAFDLGNDGAGLNANNLRLGCDCLGVIKYFDGWHTTRSGEPLKLPNVICCHEQDDGILWKHTNFRTGNAVVARSRLLILQTIITVANYEYIFAFQFGQDASIHYEVRATGIMSTCPIDIGDSVPYGTIVAPGVMAPYHQHLFCLRIDPAIDGFSNSLALEDSCAMPIDDPNVPNPSGVGYITTSQIVEQEQGLDLDLAKNRTFKIINEKRLNPVNGKPVGFKLYPAYSQMILAHPSSFHAKRSEYATHAVWVTRYDDEELYPAGRYTMQSMGGDGIASAIEKRRKDPAGKSSVRDEDIVIWHTFGSTHNPRIEDWPIMPSEKMTVGLKPVNFFTGNPSLDVAISDPAKNKSVLVPSTPGEDSGECCARL
ncbi:hypothetical protein BHE90_017169 [Fusarium euwallaceae]|uniref:Amine oxidase n=2 Tax=Fusarium solani species complex TaxID=232080 RepID=A0A428SI20_9HYPO|nr:hypothetical protein CEP52_014928 [Fusarium oligoseptatum]RTE68452.1 hypothetical protein BHE90_017169 [Fusarium euwallaceae]